MSVYLLCGWIYAGFLARQTPLGAVVVDSHASVAMHFG